MDDDVLRCSKHHLTIYLIIIITIIIIINITIMIIHYKVLALNEDGSLKLEPVDLDVGSSFDASSSYRNYIFVKIFFLLSFTILPQFSSQLLQQKHLIFLQAAPIGNIFLLTIL